MSARYAFSKGLKEVRFLFCQTGEHSSATRSFLSRAYPIMKKNNPLDPHHAARSFRAPSPKIYARYGLSDKQIEDTVTKLVKE
ncbi:predicted protein [Chaetomium globosum CBS 148.51]|uniref:Ribosomal protein/NADH dehydrogenase domain-containing protein n=1 Tax=Chaetomium globosum (strain ATCC 6205 / CBS 148.51 / DSM 1962 / NBRC 6347 / NRRL 1970) TaxID=306901 RepID=Q2H4X0_CHAGB|nr:uncharacterized protein CHGG_06295 [Chaetomium globosum CBS 148.51]EAQ89676.1 predicted protein [Chaetomium globosum CBS 148.51]